MQQNTKIDSFIIRSTQRHTNTIKLTTNQR